MPRFPKRTEHLQSFRIQVARYLLAQHIFIQPQMHDIYDSVWKKLKLTLLFNECESDICQRIKSNEFRRFAQGNK